MAESSLSETVVPSLLPIAPVYREEEKGSRPDQIIERIDPELLGSVDLQESLHLFAAIGNGAQNYSMFVSSDRGSMYAEVPPDTQIDAFAAVLLDPNAVGDQDDLLQIAWQAGFTSDNHNEAKQYLQNAYNGALRAIDMAGGMELAGAFAYLVRQQPRDTNGTLTLDTQKIDTLRQKAKALVEQLRITGILPKTKTTFKEFPLPAPAHLERKAVELTRILVVTEEREEGKKRIHELYLNDAAEEQIRKTRCCGGHGVHLSTCPNRENDVSSAQTLSAVRA